MNIKSSPAIAAALAAGTIFLAPLGEDRGPGRNTPGQICLANESRFTQATYSEGVTTYLTGWKDPENNQANLAQLAPDVIAPSRLFQFKRANNVQAFMSDADDIRAIGSPFKRVEYTGDDVYAKCLNKGLTMRVDHDSVNVKVPDWENRYAQILLQRLWRNEYRRGQGALDAAASNSGVTWYNGGTISDPDADARNLLFTAANDSGVRPNRVLYAEDAWNARSSAYETMVTVAAAAKATMTPQQLAAVLMVDGVNIGRARFQSSASAKSLIVTSMKFYAYFIESIVQMDDASHLKRFIFPCDDGQIIRVFIERGMKYTDISVEMYSVIVAAQTIGLLCKTVTLTDS